MVDYRKKTAEVEGISFELSDYKDLSFNANEVKIINLSFNPIGAYVPFDAIRFFNNSTSKIIFYPNQNPSFGEPIAGKTEKIINGLKLFSIRVDEASGASIASGDLKIKVMRSGATPETLSRRIGRFLEKVSI